MEEDTTEIKQNYLRNEIIEKGYDPEEFSTYISNIRGEEGVDLALWTMEELENVVKDFQKKQKPDLSQNANEEYKSGYIEKQQQETEIDNEKKITDEQEIKEQKDNENDNNNNVNIINNDVNTNNKDIFNCEQSTIAKVKDKENVLSESIEDFLQDSNFINNDNNNTNNTNNNNLLTYSFDNDNTAKK